MKTRIVLPRCILHALAGAILCGIAGAPMAQVYPNKPIRIIVPYPPGGVDVLARVVLTEMSKGIGQPLILENRAGANGIIGADVVARAAPDGYTLLPSKPVTTTRFW